ncbi:MAG: hypothetical protein NTV71_04040 [Candidatus Omnitrophica bacterium]|nr:hypothetical protein [Candidatus Omnitrophota bacterium]
MKPSPTIYDTSQGVFLSIFLKYAAPTSSGERSQSDSKPIRNAAVMRGIPCITTISGAQAAVNGIEAVLKNDFQVKSIQEYLSE